MAPKKPASLKVRALQWLAQREHSRAELQGKLLRLLRGSESDETTAAAEVDTLLDWLTAHGFLSQARFVESRVHAREKRFGNLRIERELQQHGVALDADALQALKASEFERAQSIWRKKYAATPASDTAARLRQMRFLVGRGFSAEVVRRVLRDAAATDRAADADPANGDD
ncbi:recombination regulator RecX [Aquincola sp. S2]|uniref:Regulatory protein RecX n=1 Tax=Pseudaquabacterium terrae TaxID=2732868 RepID=A0ABX2EKY3_9BURK|nr:recombination regulator RecX [Aquabacterium terrae]NRF69189.1 recombination regulator RecX [Aquabacterium terrae]